MDDLNRHFLSVRPLRDVAQLKALAAAAAEDAHSLVQPTDLILRGEEIVGYGSLAAVPMMHVWLHSQKVRARESVGLLNFGESILARQGHRSVIVPCWEGSPFAPHMERLGYAKLGTTTLWTKGL